MTPIRSCIAESTDNRPRDLYWCSSLGMFLVSFLYERRCLRIDLLKINCCLYVPFNIWFLCVESITFVLRNTQRNDSEGIFYLLISSWNLCHSVMGSCLCLFLRCSFRIIFVLIRYVATIAMTAFYDEALRFSAGIKRLSYSVHAECSSRWPTAWHGLFYYSAHLPGILSKTLASSYTACFDHRSGGQELFAGISQVYTG